MYYQAQPFEEVKLIRCTMGCIYEVIIDLRPNSSDFRQHFGIILSAENRRTLYIPKGFAHGLSIDRPIIQERDRSYADFQEDLLLT
jgi:dTDP-4-dehydrorhamnose 3,5-epimerase